LIWTSVRELPGWVRLLVLGRFINAAGALAWVYLTVYLVQERGLTPALAGLIVGANGAGMIAGNLLGGWFGDRFGNKPTLLAAYCGWAVLCASFPLAATALLPPISLLSGFAANVGHPVGTALVANAVPPSQRRIGIAITRAALNAGIVIGPPLGALAATYDFSLIFVIDSVSSLVLAAIVWRYVPASPRLSKAEYQRGFLTVVRRDRHVMALVAGVAVLDVAYRQLFTGLPLMLRDQLFAYGLLLAGSCVLIVFAETPLAVMMGRHPALKVVCGGWGLVAVGFAALSVWPSLGGAILGVFVISIGEMLYKPTSPAFAADRAPEGMAGRFQSLYSGASITGMVLSPPLGGLLFQYAPHLLWPVPCGLALLATAGLAYVTRGRAASRVEAIQPG
jgi:MFS family permease